MSILRAYTDMEGNLVVQATIARMELFAAESIQKLITNRLIEAIYAYVDEYVKEHKEEIISHITQDMILSALTEAVRRQFIKED